MLILTPNTSGWQRKRAFLAAILLLLIGTISAFAHARLLRSSPTDKAILEAAPAQVEFWFNELLDEGFNTISVYPAEELNSTNHTNLTPATPLVDAKDKTHLSVPLQPLKPGKYIVDYRVLSRDGHTAPGRITFTVSEAK